MTSFNADGVKFSFSFKSYFTCFNLQGNETERSLAAALLEKGR